MSEMAWDPEAEAALAKAPFFVRPLARRKVEQFLAGAEPGERFADFWIRTNEAEEGTP